MKPPTEKHAATEVVDRLSDLFDCPPKAIRLTELGATKPFDYSIVVAGQRFMAEYKNNASAGPIANAIDSLRRSAAMNADKGLPLVIVPFMGAIGRELCQQSGMSWLDLCGNAKIVAPGLRIWIEGRPNRYVARGRPPNAFAPKSSRVVRQLLLDPWEFQSQAELARKSALGDGYVSKIVRRLEQEHYLEVDKAGAVRPRDPELLLDAWRDVYDFDRHRIVKGHVSARSGDELLQRVADALNHQGLNWAATGLGAAWVYISFAAFRLTTVYLSSTPSRELLTALAFSDEPKGANLWLVVPADEGVFHGTQTISGIRCVSAVQTYLDLKDQPERAKDAAIELRGKLLNWRRHES